MSFAKSMAGILEAGGLLGPQFLDCSFAHDRTDD